MDTPRRDADSPWKDAIQNAFRPFMELFFPDIAGEIGWSTPPEFLDRELQKVVRDATLGRRYADKLVKVWLKSGTQVWILIHIEVQGEPEKEFPERMYTYNYRIYDRYGRYVVSLAVLADDDPKWRPDTYQRGMWGTETILRFRVVKLLDYEERRHEMEQSDNPFAVVVLAHLDMLKTEGDPQARLGSKFRLIRMLYKQGRPTRDVLEALRLIDWLLALPRPFEQQLAVWVDELEEELKMAYVTSFERIAAEKGMAQGMAQGMDEGMHRQLVRVLQKRFGSVPEELDSRLRALSADQLGEMMDHALAADSLDAFGRRIPASDGDSPANA